MRRLMSLPFLFLLLPTPALGGASLAAHGIAVWDTLDAAPAVLPLTGKNGWLPLAKTADAFKGDAVLSNGGIVAVLRRKDATIELHAVKPDGVVVRVRLRLQTSAGESAESLSRSGIRRLRP